MVSRLPGTAIRGRVRNHRPVVIAAVTALALPGTIGAMLAASSGGLGTFVTMTAQQAPTASGASAAAAPVLTVDPYPSETAAQASTAPIAEKPPPVVDGVRRSNVGSAHSPEIQQQLSTSAVTAPPPADAGALGVDVADYQHANGAAINWPQVAAAGYKFAFVKAAEGDYYANPYYGSDLAQAKSAGLYAAGYHFAIPNVSDGASQADFAVANGDYQPDGHTLPLPSTSSTTRTAPNATGCRPRRWSPGCPRSPARRSGSRASRRSFTPPRTGGAPAPATAPRSAPASCGWPRTAAAARRCRHLDGDIKAIVAGPDDGCADPAVTVDRAVNDAFIFAVRDSVRHAHVGAALDASGYAAGTDSDADLARSDLFVALAHSLAVAIALSVSHADADADRFVSEHAAAEPDVAVIASAVVRAVGLPDIAD